MATQDTLPASQRALFLPEILQQIIHWIFLDEEGLEVHGPEDEDGEFEIERIERKDTLFRCALTSKLWFTESIAFLWKLPPYPDLYYLWNNVEDRLAPIADRQRQAFFASFIEEGRIKVQSEDDGPSELDGVALPGLKSLCLAVPFFDSVVPKIVAPHLKKLEIDPRHEVYPDQWVEVEIMGVVLEQIPELFPNLEEVSFIDWCFVKQRDYERFKERLPRATILEKDAPSIVPDVE
ncbi:hypothetical protein BJY04DRAFT_39126 [Aspergillus karnatakaensis]|uniref:uncharacterized protein n=1 Tax=Aspergillus karnatakaensis TaxID=1810916 RepID=UPI003CCDCBA7